MDRSLLRPRNLFVLALACLVLASCIDEAKDLLGGDDDGRAAEAYDSVDVTRTESALLAASLDAAVASEATTADAIAVAVEAAAATTFTPSGCVQTTVSANVVGYDFTGCSGPYGLVELDGEAAVAFTLSGTDVEANLTATGLQARGGTLALNADARATVGTDNPTFSVTTNGAGGTASGGTILTRSGTYTVSWDEAAGCMTLTSGTWSTTIDDTAWATNVTNFEVCGQSCPARGQVSYTGSETDRSVTITFDGTNQPIFAGTDITPRTLTIDCTPAN